MALSKVNDVCCLRRRSSHCSSAIVPSNDNLKFLGAIVWNLTVKTCKNGRTKVVTLKNSWNGECQSWISCGTFSNPNLKKVLKQFSRNITAFCHTQVYRFVL